VKWTRGAGPLERAYEEMETPTVSEAPPLFPLMEIPLSQGTRACTGGPRGDRALRPCRST